MPKVRIGARDFRTLEQLDWSPSGVCVLAGPNGAGKSTTLDVLRFLRFFFQRGSSAALEAVGGQALRRLGSEPVTNVLLWVEVDDVKWLLRLPASPSGLKGTVGEELYRGGNVVLRAAQFDEGWYLGTDRLPRDETRSCARVLLDRGDSAWLEPLSRLMADFRIHDTYWLNQVKQAAPVEPQQTFLHGTGRNLWSVLANWQASPLRYAGQFDWVMRHARAAFPGLLHSIEFDRGLTYLYRPGSTDPADGLPPSRAADGLLTGLLHLTAVAGAKDGAILAFDEVENQLHPHAIRLIIHAMREMAAERDLTIVLTTHSPVVLNAFRDEPEQVYVVETTGERRPVPLPMSELHSEDWLAQASLGALYERLAFGSPLDATKP